MSSRKNDSQEKERVIKILGSIAAVLAALAAILAIFWRPELTERLLFPSATPSLTPTTFASATAPPTLTVVPPSPIPTDTLVPADTPIPPTQVVDTPVPCEWQAYVNGEVAVPTPLACLGDLAFGNIGISDLGAGKIDFSVSNSLRGIYGMVLPLGPVPQVKKGFNYTVKLNIKDLTAGRFIVAFSPNPRPDVQSAYAIVISPIESQLVTKYFFYEANEIPEQIIFQEKPAINTTQGINYTVKFVISYPNLSIEVNGGNFKPKAQQISFNGVGYIFIGYQRISSDTARTRINAEVRLP